MSVSGEKDQRYRIEPPLGSESVANVGDNLFTEGMETRADELELMIDYNFGGTTPDFMFFKGTYKYIETEDKERKDRLGNVIDRCRANVYRNASGRTIYERDDGAVHLQDAFGGATLKEYEYEIKRAWEFVPFQLSQELLYTGCDGNTLKLEYREFIGDRARPSFYVDATYDLSKGAVINFKGAQLEIIGFDNQSITYKVLRGFKTE